MKRILKLVLGLLLIGSMAFGAESAQVIITTSVGETTANSGIRVVESYTGGTDATAFDATFFSVGSVIPLLVSGKDTSVDEASGGFVVMVRRPVKTMATISVSGTTMASGTSTIPYKILSGADVYVDYTSSGTPITESYSVAAVDDGILRNAKAFTYYIPVSALAPLGTYSATVTFSMTVE